MNINNEIVKIPGRLSNRIVGTVYSTKTGNLIWKGGKTSYGCCVENCEKGFVYKNHLNRHISAVHEGKKPFECDSRATTTSTCKSYEGLFNKDMED